VNTPSRYEKVVPEPRIAVGLGAHDGIIQQTERLLVHVDDRKIVKLERLVLAISCPPVRDPELR
jgi:hypothetical protein